MNNMQIAIDISMIAAMFGIAKVCIETVGTLNARFSTLERSIYNLEGQVRLLDHKIEASGEKTQELANRLDTLIHKER